jgi:hypothetical protein
MQFQPLQNRNNLLDISISAHSDIKDLELIRRSPDPEAHEPDSIQSSANVQNKEGESLVALLSHSVQETRKNPDNIRRKFHSIISGNKNMDLQSVDFINRFPPVTKMTQALPSISHSNRHRHH